MTNVNQHFSHESNAKNHEKLKNNFGKKKT
jgi:hypothetical protein